MMRRTYAGQVLERALARAPQGAGGRGRLPPQRRRGRGVRRPAVRPAHPTACEAAPPGGPRGSYAPGRCPSTSAVLIPPIQRTPRGGGMDPLNEPCRCLGISGSCSRVGALWLPVRDEHRDRGQDRRVADLLGRPYCRGPVIASLRATAHRLLRGASATVHRPSSDRRSRRSPSISPYIYDHARPPEDGSRPRVGMECSAAPLAHPEATAEEAGSDRITTIFRRCGRAADAAGAERAGADVRRRPHDPRRSGRSRGFGAGRGSRRARTTEIVLGKELVDEYVSARLAIVDEQLDVLHLARRIKQISFKLQD
jgi:hypothetical protein